MPLSSPQASGGVFSIKAEALNKQTKKSLLPPAVVSLTKPGINKLLIHSQNGDLA